MQRGRLLLFVALILILLSIVGIFGVLWLTGALGGQPTGQGTPGPTDGGTVAVTATPAQQLAIIVAGQNLNRGDMIPTEALSVFPWPTEIVPPSAITDPSQVVGARARYTIQRGEPILSTMITQSLLQLSPFGSDAAGRIPPGFTAISIPYDKKNGVALGIRDGDYVNVIVTWALVDIDEDFQSVLPNLSAGVLGAENVATGPEGSLAPQGGIVAVVTGAGERNSQGRVERDGQLNQNLYIVPSEPQRARLVTQSIIQNVMVLHVGDFGVDAPTILVPTPVPPTPDPNATATPPPAPTATPQPPNIITLAVSPQDALVLDWLNRMKERYPYGVNVTLTLRSAGDANLADTQSVTMQYMFERYNISLPAKLNYGLDGKPLPTAVPVLTP